MSKLFSWIIPQVFYAPDEPGAGGGAADDPLKKENEKPDDDLEIDLTDETDLSELDSDSIYTIMERDDVEQEILLDWVKTGMKDKLLFKDVKIVVNADDKGKNDAADQQHADDESDKDDADKKDDLDPDKKKAADDKSDKADDGTKKATAKTDVKTDADKDKTLDVKTITVDDEYITKQISALRDQLKGKDAALVDKQVDNLKVILDAVKGGVMDTRSLKNYINAQTYIKTLKSPLDKDWKPDPKVVNTPEYIAKASKQKEIMIAAELKDKYPDYPTDGDLQAIQDFEDSLTNREYDEYKNIRDTRAKEINDRYDRYQMLTENWEDIARDTVKSEVQLFMKKLDTMKIKAADLGIQNLDLDVNYYNEYLYKNILFDEKGIPNPEIFTFVDNVIPVVKPFSLYNMLLNKNLDAIIQIREAAARKEAYRKGIDDQQDPSLSDNQQNPGQRDEIELDENAFEDDSLSIEQHQNLLDKVKQKILSGRKGKR